MGLQEWLRAAVKQLPESDSPWFDARLIAGIVTGYDSGNLHWVDTALEAQSLERLNRLLTRRRAGEPMAYLIGRQPFYGLELRVTRETLIPRPETEQLVEAALARLSAFPATIADPGTGSGAIALAIASRRRDCLVIASDKSLPALRVARDNAVDLRISNVRFVHGNWLEPFACQRFDLIVANPPYIAPGDRHLRHLGYEPQSALISAEDGYRDLEHLIVAAFPHLRCGGWLLVEHGHTQGRRLRAYAKKQGCWTSIATLRDYGGNERITLMRAPG